MSYTAVIDGAEAMPCVVVERPAQLPVPVEGERAGRFV
jgi:hypothetical protein